MRNLLLASMATLTLAAGPALADSLLSGAGAGADAGVAADVGGTGVNVGTGGGAGVRADTRTVVDAGAATDATSAATGTVDDTLAAGASTAAGAESDVQSSAQSVAVATQLIGKTVVDANGATVGEVSNAVLATDAHAVSKVVVESGGFLGFGTREVAVDAASVDASAASEGTVQLRNLTGADLDAMAEFQADDSVRLLNPS